MDAGVFYLIEKNYRGVADDYRVRYEQGAGLSP